MNARPGNWRWEKDLVCQKPGSVLVIRRLLSQEAILSLNFVWTPLQAGRSFIGTSVTYIHPSGSRLTLRPFLAMHFLSFENVLHVFALLSVKLVRF